MKHLKATRGSRQDGQGASPSTRRKSSAGAKIIAAIHEATEILRSEVLESPRLTVRTHAARPHPQKYAPDDVRRVRALLGASQAELASLLGGNLSTVRAWKQGKRVPQAIANRFLSEIEVAPTYWRKRVDRVSPR